MTSAHNVTNLVQFQLKVLCHMTTGEWLTTNDAYRSLVLPGAALC